jgi:hypothetical protein
MSKPLSGFFFPHDPPRGSNFHYQRDNENTTVVPAKKEKARKESPPNANVLRSF